MRLLIPAFVAMALAASAAPPLPEVKLPPQAREASLDEVQKLITDHPDTAILDVRTDEEVAELGKLPGAKHLDFFGENFARKVTQLGFDPARPCVVYCALGGRAKRAASVLADAGFKSILLPAGGFNAWKKAGKPVEAGK
jgi:rhodanese-related sulfurtransferase